MLSDEPLGQHCGEALLNGMRTQHYGVQVPLHRVIFRNVYRELAARIPQRGASSVLYEELGYLQVPDCTGCVQRSPPVPVSDVNVCSSLRHQRVGEQVVLLQH